MKMYFEGMWKLGKEMDLPSFLAKQRMMWSEFEKEHTKQEIETLKECLLLTSGGSEVKEVGVNDSTHQ